MESTFFRVLGKTTDISAIPGHSTSSGRSLSTKPGKVELEVGNIIQEIPVKIIESYTPEV